LFYGLVYFHHFKEDELWIQVPMYLWIQQNLMKEESYRWKDKEKEKVVGYLGYLSDEEIGTATEIAKTEFQAELNLNSTSNRDVWKLEWDAIRSAALEETNNDPMFSPRVMNQTFLDDPKANDALIVLTQLRLLPFRHMVVLDPYTAQGTVKDTPEYLENQKTKCKENTSLGNTPFCKRIHDVSIRYNIYACAVTYINLLLGAVDEKGNAHYYQNGGVSPGQEHLRTGLLQTTKKFKIEPIKTVEELIALVHPRFYQHPNESWIRHVIIYYLSKPQVEIICAYDADLVNKRTNFVSGGGLDNAKEWLQAKKDAVAERALGVSTARSRMRDAVPVTNNFKKMCSTRGLNEVGQDILNLASTRLNAEKTVTQTAMHVAAECMNTAIALNDLIPSMIFDQKGFEDNIYILKENGYAAASTALSPVTGVISGSWGATKSLANGAVGALASVGTSLSSGVSGALNWRRKKGLEEG